MFNENDEKYLSRLIGNNQVVLFLGSGFSLGVKNRKNENFPTGNELGSKIWSFLGYKGDYDNTPLQEMYQAFINAGIKQSEKKDFLESTLLSGDLPTLYEELANPFWYKIYTTNVDDIIYKIYRKTGKRIKELVYPFDQYAERDQSLEETLVNYLHGRLPGDPNNIIFSTQQYAKAQVLNEPLYGQFVYDYATLPTVFLGTNLDEPIFEKYIEAREGRFGQRERRPKSFIITPALSPVKIDNLRTNHNLHHVEGTTEDFLNWLKGISVQLPSKEEILKVTFPNLLGLFEYSRISGVNQDSIKQFAKSFNRIPIDNRPIKERSGFLIGTSPRWNDIICDLDIPRRISTEISTYIDEAINDTNPRKNIDIISLVGYAGSGKSTLLKRIGFTLSQKGHTAFLSYSDFMPSEDVLIDVLKTIGRKTVLLFDNSKNVISQIPRLINTLNENLTHLPVIVLAIRSNYTDRLAQHLVPAICDHKKFEIPNLNNEEIKNLIKKLDEHNLLGVLKGKSDQERFGAFKVRAKRQILIAMKEATKGKPFEEIIEDEYNSISPPEARLLCVCVALVTEAGFPTSKQDFVGFSKVSHNEALDYLETVLTGTIIWVGDGRRFMLRHRLLADHIIEKIVPSGTLREAYVRVLSVLAPELMKSRGPSKIYNLFRSLTNHRTLYRRFSNDIEMAREVYDSISSYFNEDAHFWLQYGSLEVEGRGGDLGLAENYLDQAESLSPHSSYIQTAKANLLFLQAFDADSFEEAKDIKNKADTLAQKLILSNGREEPHIYHIYCKGNYNYVTKWITKKEEKKLALEDMRSSISTALTFHPGNEMLKTISDAINRSYLQLGTDQEIEDPILPSFT